MIKIADVSMDSIDIEIESSSEKSTKGIQKLINTLSSLKNSLNSTQKTANKFNSFMSNFKNSFKNFKTPKISQPKINLPNGNGNKKRIEELKEKFSSLNEKINSITGRIKNMFNTIAKSRIAKTGLRVLDFGFGNISNKIADTSKRIRKLIKDFSKYALALYGIRSAFYAVRNVSNEFLSSQDAVAKQLKVNIDYLKFSLGSLLAPIIEYLTNAMYKLLQIIQYIVYYFAKINIFAGRSAKNYAAMGASAGKAAKEAQKQLQAFDELNNINLEKNSGSGGGTGDLTPEFDLSEVQDLKPLFDDIDNWGKNLAQKINKALASINWDSVIEKTTSVTKRVANILNDFTRKLDFQLIGYTIAQGFNTVFANLNTFFDTYNFAMLGAKITQGINSFINTLNWEDLGKSLTNGFRSLIDVLYPIAAWTEWGTLGENVAKTIMASFRNIDWKKVGQTINNGTQRILDAILTMLDNISVEEISNNIADMLREIKWVEIFTRVVQVAAKLVAGLGEIVWKSLFTTDLWKIVLLALELSGLKLAFKTLFQVIGLKLITSLAGVSSAVKTTGSTASKAAKGVTSLKTGFNNLLTSLGKATEIIAVLGGLALVINSLTGLLDVFAQSNLSVGEALGFLVGTIGIITLAFTAMMGVMTMLKPSWQSIAGAVVILGGFALVLNQVTGLITALGEAGISANKVIGIMAEIGLVIVALMASVAILGPAMTAGLIPFLAIVGGISAMLIVMKETIPTILDAAGKFVQTIAPSVIKMIDSIGNAIEKIIKALGETLPPIINFVGNLATKIFNGIATVVKSVGEVITNIFKGVQSALSTIFNGIGTVVKSVGEVITNIFKGVQSTLSTIFNGISKVFSTVFNGIANVAKSIGNVITGIFNGIGNVVTSIGNAISKILNSIAGLINTTLNALLNFAWQIGPAIENSVNAILRSVTRLINFVISAMEFLVNNTVIKAVNGIIDTLNQLPMFNISRKSNISLPRFSGYAEGGFPDEGEFFLARESGPEMVGSIGNKTAVANNDQITKAIAQAAYQAMNKALNENDNNGQPLNIYFGNERLYSGYTKHKSQASNQYGISI